MIIDRERWGDWLDPDVSDVADVRAVLVPAAVSGLHTYPVSFQVNSVRNNGAQLIEPLSGSLTGREHADHGTKGLF